MKNNTLIKLVIIFLCAANGLFAAESKKRKRSVLEEPSKEVSNKKKRIDTNQICLQLKEYAADNDTESVNKITKNIISQQIKSDNKDFSPNDIIKILSTNQIVAESFAQNISDFSIDQEYEIYNSLSENYYKSSPIIANFIDLYDEKDRIVKKLSQFDDLDTKGVAETRARLGNIYAKKGKREISNANFDAAINAISNEDKTPLIKLALHKNLAVITKWLVKHKCKINKPDHYGITALHQAAENESPEMVKFLTQNGANTNAQDKFGWTPAHSTTINENYLNLSELLGPKTDTHIKTNEGKTILDLIVERHQSNDNQLNTSLQQCIQKNITDKITKTLTAISNNPYQLEGYRKEAATMKKIINKRVLDASKKLIQNKEKSSSNEEYIEVLLGEKKTLEEYSNKAPIKNHEIPRYSHFESIEKLILSPRQFAKKRHFKKVKTLHFSKNTNSYKINDFSDCQILLN